MERKEVVTKNQFRAKELGAFLIAFLDRGAVARLPSFYLP